MCASPLSSPCRTLRAALSRCAARWIADDTVHVDGGSTVQLHRNRNHFCEGTKHADKPHGRSFTFE
jgi:hypothetical protein